MRRGRRNSARGGQKFSSETDLHLNQLPQGLPGGGEQTVWHAVVPNSTLYGMRKAKNFDIQIDLLDPGDELENNFVEWALVYVPEGMVPGNIALRFGHNINQFESMYEPNQHLIASGIISGTEPSVRKFSPLARNLNSGDQIIMVISQWNTAVAATAAPIGVHARVNYAMAV
jgi:hypothetical protein